jgi:Mu-like prophage tail sheath protein gpL
VSVICNGVEYAAGVAKNDEPGSIAVELANVINNTPDAPFTAVATLDDSTPTGEVVLTAKCKGAYISASAGGLNVSVASEAEGITAGSITPTAGVGTVSLETALAAAFPERFHIIVSPVNDATNLGYLKTTPSICSCTARTAWPASRMRNDCYSDNGRNGSRSWCCD